MVKIKAVPRLKTFDRKFGSQFLKEAPQKPGVYRIYDSEGKLIYVGKAKNLRRRLAQYRNAQRLKKHEKMRSIVRDAARLEYEVCESEIAALALELRLIQEFRPRWNVAGAFFFLYPMIGIRRSDGVCSFCYTTCPEEVSDFEFHGAYRSRRIVGDAFFSLMHLLEYIGHRVPIKARVRGKYAYIYSFRQLSQEWDKNFNDFLRGDSKQVLEHLILALVENAAARNGRTQVQDQLNDLVRFWRHEASVLFKVRKHVGDQNYPVSQKERDLLFLKYTHKKMMRDPVVMRKEVSHESCDSASD